MSDDDMIRRGDARRVMLAYASSYSAKEAETAIAALPAAPTFTAADLERAWQSIETAPKNGTLFLAWRNKIESHTADGAPHGYWALVFWSKYGFWADYWDGDPADLYPPTHWMPLPAPPADPAQLVKEVTPDPATIVSGSIHNAPDEFIDDIYEHLSALNPVDDPAVQALVEAGNRMANSIKGDYIHPGAATAWDAALAAFDKTD